MAQPVNPPRRRRDQASGKTDRTNTPGLDHPSDCLRATVRGYMVHTFMLTPRQLDVLELLAEGQRTREIAQQLRIKPRAVEDLISDLIKKLYVDDRAGLVARWVQALYAAIDGFGLHLPPHELTEHQLRLLPPLESWRTPGRRQRRETTGKSP